MHLSTHHLPSTTMIISQTLTHTPHHCAAHVSQSVTPPLSPPSAHALSRSGVDAPVGACTAVRVRTESPGYRITQFILLLQAPVCDRFARETLVPRCAVCAEALIEVRDTTRSIVVALRRRSRNTLALVATLCLARLMLIDAERCRAWRDVPYNIGAVDWGGQGLARSREAARAGGFSVNVALTSFSRNTRSDPPGYKSNLTSQNHTVIVSRDCVRVRRALTRWSSHARWRQQGGVTIHAPARRYSAALQHLGGLMAAHPCLRASTASPYAQLLSLVGPKRRRRLCRPPRRARRQHGLQWRRGAASGRRAFLHRGRCAAHTEAGWSWR